LPFQGKPFSTGAYVVGARCLPVRAVVLVKLMMVRLVTMPHRGVSFVAMDVSERHRRGSEGGYEQNSKSFLENVFHGNPGGSKGVSDERCNATGDCDAGDSLAQYSLHKRCISESQKTQQSHDSTGSTFNNPLFSGVPASRAQRMHTSWSTSAGRIRSMDENGSTNAARQALKRMPPPSARPMTRIPT